MQNPFTTTFSKAPGRTYIPTAGEEEIIENFSYDEPSESVYKITGVRGSGKTVLLSKVEEEYQSEKNRQGGWLVYRLSPSRDMLQQFAAKLHKESFMKGIPGIRGINVSATILGTGGGIGVSREEDLRFFDIGTEIEQMLAVAARNRKKILLGIDEVSKTKEMVVFASEFGKWLRGGFPVFLVCTGLYENIRELSNVKNLTFFRRASTVQTEPLSFVRMSEVYRRSLEVDVSTAKKLSMLTKGYAYAFQALGVMYFKTRQEENAGNDPSGSLVEEAGSNEEEAGRNGEGKGGIAAGTGICGEGLKDLNGPKDLEDDRIDAAAARLREELYAYSYEKIWEELTAGDRFFVSLLAEKEEYQREEIIARMGEKASGYSMYRDRLLKRGLLLARRGFIGLSLPYFGDYIREYWQ